MSDIQKTIVVNGKEYMIQPQAASCEGCAAFMSSPNGGSSCMEFPSCKGVIFVEAIKPVASNPTPLTEVARLCDEARADGHSKGYAEGWADRGAGKWKISGTGTTVPCSVVSSTCAVVLDPSGAHGVYGVARTSDPATSHKAANNMVRKAGRIADLILVELRNANLTGSELAARTGVALNSITPRFAQLFRKGLIHAAGGSGRETVWAIGNGIHVAPRPDTPDSHWCVGCTPDNCAGCDGSAASNVATA